MTLRFDTHTPWQDPLALPCRLERSAADPAVMRVLVAGGTGLVGAPVVRALASRGDTVAVLGRSAERIAAMFAGVVPAVRAVTWAELTPALIAVIAPDCVINLSGENVGAGLWWTKTSMAAILDSRTATTSQLAAAMAGSGSTARLLSASGVSFYGDSDAEMNEASEAGAGAGDYLAGVSVAWEAAALSSLPAERCTFLRFGIVLTKGGGALGKMELPFRLGLGGRVGPGTQAMSWISLVSAAPPLPRPPPSTSYTHTHVPRCHPGTK